MSSSIIIRHIELGLKLIGLWPDSKTTFGFYLTILCLLSQMPFQFWHASAIYHNIEALMANLGVLLTVAAAAIKLIAFRMRGKNVRYAIREMLNDWIDENQISDDTIMKRQVSRGSYYTKWLIVAYNGVVIMYAINAVKSYFTGIIEKRVYIIPAKYPTAWKQSPYYEIVVLTQFIVGSLSNNFQAMIEGLLIILVLHAGTKVHILRRELADMSVICRARDDKELASKAMKKIIKKHWNFVDFVEKIKDIYFFVSFFHVGIFSLLLVCIAYMCLNTIEKHDSPIKIFMYGLFTIRALFSTMIHCAAGEYMMNQSHQLCKNLYDIPWYEFNLNDKKALNFIIMKARKPMCLTPAKCGNLSLNYLLGVIRTSYSFLSLVRVTH